MRISTNAALLLPALSGAQAQLNFSQLPFSSQISAQFSSLWSNIQPYLPSPVITTLPAGSKPIFETGRTSKPIHNLTAKTWASELESRATQPWLVLISGRNLTCGAYNSSCANVDAAWATASAAAVKDSRAPNLAYVNCEDNRLLCSTWGATPGSVWWVEPEVRVTKVANTGADTEGKGATLPDAPVITEVSREIYVVPLNKTTVTAADITGLYRKGEYKTRGALLSSEEIISRHPFDGKLAKFGLNVPVGYALYVFSMVPGWSTIMMISFTARMFMRKQGQAARPKETPAQKAEREHKEKYQENGKVRGAAPGDGTNMGRL